jgi:hypothetical protein
LLQQQFKHTAGKTRMAKSPGGKCMGSRSFSWDLTPNPLTPAMEAVMRKRSKKTFRRRFRSTGESKETEELELDLTSCTSESDVKEDNNNAEMKSSTKLSDEVTSSKKSTDVTRSTDFNSPMKTRSSTGHKPIAATNNHEKLKSVPKTLNVRGITKTQSITTRRRRSSVNKCTFM